ncbi:MAG: type IV pilus secretin PilQ family protein [Xanthomonadales bacterium]|nr:type IV pilus secretin PilQ family protein [Xanthomonadales bacterium]
MHSKKDITLKGILTGMWGQFMDSRKTGIHLGLGLALLVLPALSAWAASDVTAANYSSSASGEVVITLSTDGDDPNVSVFATESPARIILDLADTNSQVDASPVTVGIGAVQKFTTLAAGGRTRVMVDLSKLVTYDYQIADGQVVLTIEGNGEGSTAPSSSSGTARFTVENIDFRRGADGQSKVIISLDKDSSNISVNLREGGLSVDVFDTNLPDILNQRLDVVDFATPVQIIDSEELGSSVRVELEVSGLYEHMAYQSDNDWIIEVSALKATSLDASEEIVEFYQEKEYEGARVTFNFQDIPVRSVLQLIADVSNLNIVVADNVGGNLTLRLTNVPWDQALDIVLDARNLDKRENGNVIWIAPTADIAAREQQLLQAFQDRKELEPLVTSLIAVSYATAKDLQALIDSARSNSQGGADAGLLSDRGSIAIDERTNTLMVTDTLARVEAIQKLVRDLDHPVRQVQIESRIVIASSEFAHAIGVRFGVTALHNKRNILAVAGDGQGADLLNPATNPRDDGLLDLPGIPERYNVNLPVADSNAGSIGLSFLAGNVLLDLELTALEAEGDGEIISTPRVVTSNQSEAYIQQGVEIPYEQAASSGATAVQFKDAVLELRVTPLITPDNRVQLELDVKQDSVGEIYQTGRGGSVPSIDTRELSTSVLVNNGETIVLGGIFQDERLRKEDRVPYLSSIPVLGHLFKRRANETKKRELLIFVTPTIVEDRPVVN